MEIIQCTMATSSIGTGCWHKDVRQRWHCETGKRKKRPCPAIPSGCGSQAREQPTGRVLV